MSAYSTLCISRRKALELYYYVTDRTPPSDKLLESVLDAALDHALYNVFVTDAEAREEDEVKAEFWAEVINP